MIINAVRARTRAAYGDNEVSRVTVYNTSKTSLRIKGTAENHLQSLVPGCVPFL